MGGSWCVSQSKVRCTAVRRLSSNCSSQWRGSNLAAPTPRDPQPAPQRHGADEVVELLARRHRAPLGGLVRRQADKLVAEGVDLGCVVGRARDRAGDQEGEEGRDPEPDLRTSRLARGPAGGRCPKCARSQRSSFPSAPPCGPSPSSPLTKHRLVHALLGGVDDGGGGAAPRRHPRLAHRRQRPERLVGVGLAGGAGGGGGAGVARL